MLRILTACRQAIDLIDLIVFLGFLLITVGIWLLWGTGWACLSLGLLLLALVLVGVPSPKKP